jgi:endonuclease YncB( thermonuclease family)
MMIKKIFMVFMLLFSITLLVGCTDDTTQEIVLPNLSGMNKTQALAALSGLNIQVFFDDVIDNTRTEGLFSNYGDNMTPGMVVEPQTQVTVYFVVHEVLDGLRLPDLTGLNYEQILDILFEEDINLLFEDFPTNNIQEGLFAGYANNYQAGMIVPFFSNLTVYLAIEDVFISSNLIISTYVEGLNDNKAIEIANRSSAAIDLSEYRISLYLDGSETISTNIPLTGTLEPLAVYVIAFSGSQPELLEKADLVTPDLTFDGNDAVAITFRNGAVVDIIGTPGWAFFYLRNETFVRKPSITTGSQSFSQLDWDIYAMDNFSMVGSHPTIFPTSFTYNPEHLLISFDLPSGMVKVTYGFANDGDTSTFYSLDPNIPDFTGGNRIRFIGIDTPEMSGNDPNKQYPEPYAVEATNYLRDILENATEIYIQHDPSTGTADTYARTLGLIWADGVLVNVEMVRMGFSTAKYDDNLQRLIFNGVSLNRWFQWAEQEAQTYRRGIWS